MLMIHTSVPVYTAGVYSFNPGGVSSTEQVENLPTAIVAGIRNFSVTLTTMMS